MTDHNKYDQYDDLISVIVITYNWPEALYLVLLSFNQQMDQNFEVLIVDDGSTITTKNLINEFKTHARFAITHLWQEDQGFRAAKARNLGIKAAKGKYIIFLDGDCIPRFDFVTKHRLLAQEAYYVEGNRILLTQAYSQKLLKHRENIGDKTLFFWFKQRLLGHINRWHTLTALPIHHPFRYKNTSRWQKTRTCNMGIWHKDLLDVRGFEERISGWGYEDSDLAIRLLNHHVKRKSGYFATTVLHLWHREIDRTKADENRASLKQIIDKEKTQAVESCLYSFR